VRTCVSVWAWMRRRTSDTIWRLYAQ